MKKDTTFFLSGLLAVLFIFTIHGCGSPSNSINYFDPTALAISDPYLHSFKHKGIKHVVLESKAKDWPYHDTLYFNSVGNLTALIQGFTGRAYKYTYNKYGQKVRSIETFKEYVYDTLFTYKFKDDKIIQQAYSFDINAPDKRGKKLGTESFNYNDKYLSEVIGSNGKVKKLYYWREDKLVVKEVINPFYDVESSSYWYNPDGSLSTIVFIRTFRKEGNIVETDRIEAIFTNGLLDSLVDDKGRVFEAHYTYHTSTP